MKALRFLFSGGLVLVLAAISGVALSAGEEILAQVRTQQAEATKANQAREARFQKERDAAAAANAQVQRELKALESESEALRKQYDANTRVIGELEKRLDMQSGDTADIPGTIRQSADTLSRMLSGSVAGTHAPGRDELLQKLSDEKHLPDAADLEALWHMLENQFAASSRIERFEGEVSKNGGDPDRMDVIRIGDISAITDGLFRARYLGWQPGLGLVSGRQPDSRLRRVAHAYASAESGLAPMMIDPSAGAMLSDLARQPDMTRFAIVAILLLTSLLFVAAPVVRRRWIHEGKLHHHAAVAPTLWARAATIYDRRFWVALSVSNAHLIFLLWLLITLFGFQLSSLQVAQAEEIFEITQVGPPGDPGDSGGSPAPPAAAPPPPPSLAAISTAPTLPAPSVKIPTPSLNFSVKPSASTLFSSKFSGFAGTGSGAGSGAGAGAGGYGRGRGGGGKPLIPLSTARPQISEYAYRRGIEGWVVVSFTVTRDGNVRDIRIVDAEPKGVFEAAAVESIANWIYPRLDRDSHVTQRVEFKLEDYKYNWK